MYHPKETCVRAQDTHDWMGMEWGYFIFKPEMTRRVAIPISDKVYFKTKAIKRRMALYNDKGIDAKEGYYTQNTCT